LFRAPRADFWRVGVAPISIADLTEAAALSVLKPQIIWLPESEPWRYIADPFGLQRADAVHLFVESFDYRTKHAVIERHELAGDLSWRGKTTVLARPFHLSYPFIVEHAGETFMVPESHQANEIALYRAHGTLDHWVRETALLSGISGAEPSLIHYQDRWWMFYTVVGSQVRDQRELHLAYADALTGPWHRHALNPVLIDRSGARPGGTPFVGHDGLVVLPVQDCSEGYGGATRLLRFTVLDERRVAFEHLPARFTGGLVSHEYQAGLHTLSACGSLTLIDVKKVTQSRGKQWLDLKRRSRRWASKFGFRSEQSLL
jgi:hypothetical protein